MHAAVMRRSVRNMMMMIVAVGLMLCSARSHRALAHAQQPASQPPKPAATAPVPESPYNDPVVTLLEPGAEPRQTLRLKPKKGTTSAFEMIMNMKMAMSMGGMQQPAQVLPGMRMVAQMDIADVKPNGDTAFELEYTDASLVETPGVQPMVLNMMRGKIETLKGTRASGVLNNRCMPRDVTVKVAENADPMMRQQIDQLSQSLHQISVPLPEEPIGVGGRWRVESEMTAGGLAFKMTNEVTLKRIEGNVITMEMAITQSAEPQDMNNPQLPPGAKVHLNSLKSSGTGTSTMDLTRIAPLAGESKMTSDTDMTITMPTAPQPQQMTQHMEIAMKAKDTPVKPAGAAPTTQPAGRP